VFFSLAWFTPLDPHEQLVLTAYKQLVLGIIDRPDHAGSQQQQGGGGDLFDEQEHLYQPLHVHFISGTKDGLIVWII
jgi:hypothetical protein